MGLQRLNTLIKWYTLIAWFILLSMLIGCRKLSRGVVLDKHFSPAYYTHYNKSMHYHPPVYKIQVQGQTVNWETITEWWRVSSGNYDRIKIGDKVDSTVIKYW